MNSRWIYFSKFCWCSEHVLLAKHQLAMIGWGPHMLLNPQKCCPGVRIGLGWAGTGQHSLGSWLPSAWLAISLLCVYKESTQAPMIEWLWRSLYHRTSLNTKLFYESMTQPTSYKCPLSRNSTAPNTHLRLTMFQSKLSWRGLTYEPSQSSSMLGTLPSLVTSIGKTEAQAYCSQRKIKPNFDVYHISV